MEYTKKPISFELQIEKIESRGMKFNDKEKSKNYLSNISCYRLQSYTYPFQYNQNPVLCFVEKISFEDIVALYVFDRQLRLLLLNAIEKIEIALRTKIIYYFALDFDRHWYKDKTLYFSEDKSTNDLKKLYEDQYQIFDHHCFHLLIMK